MGKADALIDKIERAIGAANCAADPERATTHGVCGVRPLAAACPGSEDELRCILEIAREAGIAIIPAGGATRVDIGLPPRGDYILVYMSRLCGVVDYDPANLTVSARAGASIGELQPILASEGQFLPLDPPSKARSTLGGVLASNSSGPLRLRYGSSRDLALGVRAMLSDGRILRFGSKTVKNVAGYDMVKLFVGSWGTLGAICEATVRVYPLPEAEGAIIGRFKGLDGALAAADELLRSRLSPFYLSVLSPGAAEGLNAPGFEGRNDGGYLMAVGSGGLGEEVQAHLTDATAACVRRGASSIVELCGEEERSLRMKLEDYPDLLLRGGDETLLLRASLPGSKQGDFLRGIRSIAAEEGWRCEFAADPGFGSTRLAITVSGGKDEAGSKAVLALTRQLAGLCDGNVRLERGPAGLKSIDGVWGDPGAGALSLMKALKLALDPHNLFSPGRFVGGI